VPPAGQPIDVTVHTSAELEPSLITDWNRLALHAEDPFVSYEWLISWWSAFGDGVPAWLLLRGQDQSLRAGALLRRASDGRLVSATNVHSGYWNIVAADSSARAELWAALARLGARHIELQAMPDWEQSPREACAELERAGYRIIRQPGQLSPWLELPQSWEELIGAVSGGLRSQVNRRRRALDRTGSLTFRTTIDGPALDSDLEAFLELEASGWKAESGTAILSKPTTEKLYRGFAHAAAKQAWLRLYMLELDGQLIAADYGCVFAGRAFFLKTAFSEAHSRLSPGLVLRAEVLRASIEEGLGSYDFLGGPDDYKLRWTSQLRPRVQIDAYRGSALMEYAYRARLRPLLKTVRGGLKKRVGGSTDARAEANESDESNDPRISA
jgi:CelD/BcsL family acetyltransferase involved in cellulose biosynthesis